MVDSTWHSLGQQRNPLQQYKSPSPHPHCHCPTPPSCQTSAPIDEAVYTASLDTPSSSHAGAWEGASPLSSCDPSGQGHCLPLQGPVPLPPPSWTLLPSKATTPLNSVLCPPLPLEPSTAPSYSCVHFLSRGLGPPCTPWCLLSWRAGLGDYP